MKQITLVIFFCFISLTVLAQDQDKVTTLIKEGIALHDGAKYQDAITKYKEALQLDPDNAQANYEIAFTLFNTNAGKEAIPYLNKIVAGKSSIVVNAYDMLGSIYDMDNQADKAIEYFKLGINANPNYQRIYFNLAVTYSRNGKNEDAVENITKALKLMPGHASSHNVYAVTVSANSNSKIKSLYAYCNFLILEANSARSASAYNALKAILNSGLTKKDGVNNITLGIDEKDADLNAANLLISMSGISGAAIPNITDADKFELQLKTIFSGIGKISEKKKDKDFFWSFYADYFYKLSQTEFMPLVARIISFSANKEENGKWIKEHEQQLKDFSKWMSTESIQRS